MTHFARISTPIAAALLVLAPAAGHAQADDRGLAALMRECRTLADIGARMACYDGIALDDVESQQQSAPPPVAERERRSDTGFGSNQLPRAPADEPGREHISARVTRAVERQPGLYLLTLEDGSQWQFVDAAPAAYDPPRAGSTVEISKAAMGSYLIRYAGQRSVRARRVR